jgi:glutathione S-transferase
VVSRTRSVTGGSILARGMRTLYGLTQSPYTEKARWALEHHAVAYRYHEHVPVLGEVLLRLKARRRPAGTKASVPLLVDDDRVLTSSLAIARHADSLGRAPSLFPAALEGEVERWAALSDRMLGAGRARVLVGLRKNRAAQLEALPPFIPGPLRSLMTPMSVTAAVFLASKHEVPRDPDAEAESVLRPALAEVRKSLGGRATLLDGFTFADVAIASALQVLTPRARAPFGPGTRAIWENAALAREYEDLVAWRDAVYAKHRPGG